MTIKAMIHIGQNQKTDLKKRIKDMSGEVLADYNKSILTRIEKSKLAKLEKEGWRIRVLPKDKNIQVNAFHFNPSIKKFQSTLKNSKTISLPSGRSHHLLRLVGPIHKDWLAKLESYGVQFYGQVIKDEHLISIDNSKISNVKRLKFVESLSPYFPELKINQSLLTKKSQTKLSQINGLKKVVLHTGKTLQTDETNKAKEIKVYRNKNVNKDKNRVAIELVLFDVKDRKKVAKAVKDLGGDLIKQLDSCLVINTEESLLVKLAAIPEVKEINPHEVIGLHNNVASGIMNVDDIRNDFNLDGTGQIVAVADTGLDTGINDANILADFRGRVVNIHALGRPGNASDTDGHGTHVAGSVLGNGTNSNGNIQGMAPGAQLLFQSILDANGGLGGLPPNLGEGLFDLARNEGAFIHSNSWGAANNGAYTARSAQTDTFAFNNRDFLILFSAGNDAPNKVGSPGSAKNVLTIGASESVRTLPASVSFPASPAFPTSPVINGWNTEADNQNHIADFSSLGPAQNNRIKPDVVAPGSWILSSRSSVSLYDSGPDGLGPNEVGGGTGDENGIPTHDEAVGLGLPGQGVLRAGDQNTPALPAGSGVNAFQNYMYLSGTSMATPIMAGSCALLRQHLLGQGISNPSAALIKAMVINGAVDMGLDHTEQGWGRSDMNNTIVPPGGIQFDDNINNALESGDFRAYNVQVTSSGQALTITLVWRDPANSAIQNQLFLRARHVASGDEFSFETEGSPVLNNVQKIIIPSPELGLYEIEVEALNISMGIPEFPGELRQDYALVISNAVGLLLQSN